MRIKRVPSNSATLGANDMAGIVNNARAGATKTMSVGPQLQIPPGATQVQGISAAAGIKVNPGTSLWLYNNSGATAWATMAPATATLAAPNGIANGIPLAPNTWTYLNMGDNAQLQTSSATVGVYMVQDDTSFSIITDGQPY